MVCRFEEEDSLENLHSVSFCLIEKRSVQAFVFVRGEEGLFFLSFYLNQKQKLFRTPTVKLCRGKKKKKTKSNPKKIAPWSNQTNFCTAAMKQKEQGFRLFSLPDLGPVSPLPLLHRRYGHVAFRQTALRSQFILS